MDAFTDVKFDGNQAGLINKHNPRVVVGGPAIIRKGQLTALKI